MLDRGGLPQKQQYLPAGHGFPKGSTSPEMPAASNRGSMMVAAALRKLWEGERLGTVQLIISSKITHSPVAVAIAAATAVVAAAVQ